MTRLTCKWAVMEPRTDRQFPCRPSAWCLFNRCLRNCSLCVKQHCLCPSLGLRHVPERQLQTQTKRGCAKLAVRAVRSLSLPQIIPPIAIFGFDYRRLEPCIPNVSHRLGAARSGKLKPWNSAYGLLLAAGAFGGITAEFMAEAIIKRFGPKRTAQVSLMLSAPSFLLMAMASNWLTLALTIAIFEFAGLTWNTVSVSYRQRKIPDAMLGRVNSLYRLLALGLMPIGLILSGLIVGYAEPIVGRSQALNLSIFTASTGALILGILGWQALNRGFSLSDQDQPVQRL